jgi:hypothetical protein
MHEYMYDMLFPLNDNLASGLWKSRDREFQVDRWTFSALEE